MKSAGNSCTCFVCVLGFVGFRVSNSKNGGASCIFIARTPWSVQYDSVTQSF